MIIERKAGDKVSLKKKDAEKEVKDIQGVDCIIYEYPEAYGNEDVTRDENGLITSITTDKTKRPEVEMKSGVAFCYDGYVYTIENHSEEEELAFAEEYIKALKENK